jgi:putative transposase
MPGHVDLILVPSDETGLSRAVGEAHRRYAAFITARARVTGPLFQGRFGSVVMDEEHLMHAVRTLALNPVKAKLVRRARDWPHASVRAHRAGADDALVSVQPLLDRAPQCDDLLALSRAEQLALEGFESKGSIGRPMGSAAFIAGLEERTGRVLAARKRGRKARSESAGPS